MRSTTTFRVLAAAMTLALLGASCGRDDDQATDGDGTATTAAPSDGAFINPDEDCTDYQATAGISGDTITIGTVRPASGPYSIYDTVTKGIEKYFEAANAKGGLKAGDGKTYKVNLIKEDDGYDPGRTPGAVKKLVEQDGVFALVGQIGTETNLAVRDYVNQKCVPSVSLATGSTEWGRAGEYPWYIAGLPSYATEAVRFLDFLSEEKPEAKIALLYQADDFGEAYKKAIEKYIADKGAKFELVGEESYDPASGQTTEASVVKLAGTGADVFFVGIGGTACPKTLTFVPASWTPMTYVSITCSGKIALSLAGGKDEGIYSTQALLDPSNPEDAANPKTVAFLTDGQAQGLTQTDLEGGILSAGWGFAAIFAKALELTTDVTRAGLMNTLWSMQDQTFGLLRDDVKATTDGADDPWLIESLRVIKRQGGQWTEAAPMVDYGGKSNSFAG